MGIAAQRCLPALICVTFVHLDLAASAEPDRKFEGPYHVAITPLERVRATVTSTFRFPELDAQEWWAAFPWPPEFEGQPSARVQVRIAEAPFAEADRIADESALSNSWRQTWFLVFRDQIANSWGQTWFLVFRDGTGSSKKPETKSDLAPRKLGKGG